MLKLSDNGTANQGGRPVRIPPDENNVGERLQARMPQAWRWYGRHVKLFDGTTVSMPDSAQNQAAFPQNPEQKPGIGA
jgi:hypothetical protein